MRLTLIPESLFRPYRNLKNKKASVRETDANFSQIFNIFTLCFFEGFVFFLTVPNFKNEKVKDH